MQAYVLYTYLEYVYVSRVSESAWKKNDTSDGPSYIDGTDTMPIVIFGLPSYYFGLGPVPKS